MIIDAKIHFVYFDCSLTHIQQINVDLNLIKIFINHTQQKHKKHYHVTGCTGWPN